VAKLFLLLMRIAKFAIAFWNGERRIGLRHGSARGRSKGTVLVASGKFPKPAPSAGTPANDRTRHTGSREHDIGGALRAAYDSAVNEEIPAEMLDLLSKLR
jgi:Anti-sigma factor NepR